MLIESPTDETEAQLRAYVDALLVQIYGRMPEWLEYKIGERCQRKNKFYREFICPAAAYPVSSSHMPAAPAELLDRSF